MIKQLKDLSMFFFCHDSFTLHAIILKVFEISLGFRKEAMNRLLSWSTIEPTWYWLVKLVSKTSCNPVFFLDGTVLWHVVWMSRDKKKNIQTSLTSQYHVGSIVDQERSRFIASFLNPRLISNTFSVTSEFIWIWFPFENVWT
jgi:hypothetical protein